jgi:uncharacterized protein
MSEKIIERIKSKKFKYYFEHTPIFDEHWEPIKYFDLIFKFFEARFS